MHANCHLVPQQGSPYNGFSRNNSYLTRSHCIARHKKETLNFGFLQAPPDHSIAFQKTPQDYTVQSEALTLAAPALSELEMQTRQIIMFCCHDCLHHKGNDLSCYTESDTLVVDSNLTHQMKLDNNKLTMMMNIASNKLLLSKYNYQKKDSRCTASFLYFLDHEAVMHCLPSVARSHTDL